MLSNSLSAPQWRERKASHSVSAKLDRLPEFALADPQEKYVIEGHGVDPDIEVENDPAAVIEGRDPQLERAIAETSKGAAGHAQDVASAAARPR